MIRASLVAAETREKKPLCLTIFAKTSMQRSIAFCKHEESPGVAEKHLGEKVTAIDVELNPRLETGSEREMGNHAGQHGGTALSHE